MLEFEALLFLSFFFLFLFLHLPAVLLFVCLFSFFRAASLAYGGSQARGLIGATAVGPQPWQCQIRAESAAYTTAHGNARSLTH